LGDLFDRARAGDAAAQAEIHQILRAFARDVCRGKGPGGALDVDWEDVAQEAGRKLFAVGMYQYRGWGSEKSFLYSVVRSTVIQMCRSAGRRRQREEGAPPPDAVHPNPGRRIDVMRVLAGLSTECRDLVERVFLAGDSYEEIASDLGLAPSSVRSRLSRCVKQARKISEEGGDR
jgi:RNA polymerase sigma-70 factor (ECF subfamily)